MKFPELYPATERAPHAATLVGYLAQADECIRQMEWARTRQWVQIDSSGQPFIHSGDWGTPWHMKSLTLAPEDWKP